MGDSHQGFMSEVKDELKVRLDDLGPLTQRARIWSRLGYTSGWCADRALVLVWSAFQLFESFTVRATSAWTVQILFDEINSYNRRVSKNNDNKDTLALAVTMDDLDRCSQKKILEMLTATHLLLEQHEAPMVIFLAVDPQLIASAIVESGGVENKVALHGEIVFSVVSTPLTKGSHWGE